MPTLCAPTDAPALAALAKAALTGPGHVRTLVVALPSLGDSEIAAGLEPIALAGGTEHALALAPHADFSRQLSNALSAAAARQVACDLAVPEPSARPAPRLRRCQRGARRQVARGRCRASRERLAAAPVAAGTTTWTRTRRARPHQPVQIRLLVRQQRRKAAGRAGLQHARSLAHKRASLSGQKPG